MYLFSGRLSFLLGLLAVSAAASPLDTTTEVDLASATTGTPGQLATPVASVLAAPMPTSESNSFRAFATAPLCETSEYSPNEDDVLAGAEYFHNLNKNCCQTQNKNRFCTTMYTFREAGFQLCGTYNKCVPCSNLYAYFYNMLFDCRSNHRIGGQQVLNENSELKIQIVHN